MSSIDDNDDSRVELGNDLVIGGERTKLRGGNNKDPCWTHVECIPLDSTDHSRKTKVLCTQCHSVIGTYVGKVKVERIRKHFSENRCTSSDSAAVPPTSTPTSTRERTTVSSSRLSEEARENFRQSLAAFFLESGVDLAHVESHDLRYSSAESIHASTHSPFSRTALRILRADFPMISRKEIEGSLLDKAAERALSERGMLKAKHVSFAIHNSGSLARGAAFLTKIDREVFVDQMSAQNSEDADAMRDELEQVIGRAPIGAECAGLTTDSDSAMQSLWALVKSSHPRMFCQGDAALALRRVVEEVVGRIKWLRPLTAAAADLIGMVLRHHRALGLLTEKETTLDSKLWAQISEWLASSPLGSPLDADGGDGHEVDQRHRDSHYQHILKAVRVLQPFVAAITHLESHAAVISDVFHLFQSLPKTIDDLENSVSREEKSLIKECIQKQWSLLYSDAHGVSHLLDPRYLGDGMDEDTTWKVTDFIAYKFPYNCSATDRCASAELTDFLNTFRDARESNPRRLDQFLKAQPTDSFPQTTVYEFWRGMNSQRWAHLREIALIVFSLCATSSIKLDDELGGRGFRGGAISSEEEEQKASFCRHNLRQISHKRKRDDLEE